MSSDQTLDAEDAKLVTLARSARARTGATEGAAVRDDMGRTYAAASVGLDSLRLSALQAAVAAAVSSASHRFEAAAVVGEAEELSPEDRRLAEEIGVPSVIRVAPDGSRRP